MSLRAATFARVSRPIAFRAAICSHGHDTSIVTKSFEVMDLRVAALQKKYHSDAADRDTRGKQCKSINNPLLEYEHVRIASNMSYFLFARLVYYNNDATSL